MLGVTQVCIVYCGPHRESANWRKDTHLALPPTDRLRMSLAGMLGIFSSVLFWRTSRLGAILAPMWGAMSPHLQPSTQPLSRMTHQSTVYGVSAANSQAGQPRIYKQMQLSVCQISFGRDSSSANSDNAP